jgi:hypothetical protein
MFSSGILDRNSVFKRRLGLMNVVNTGACRIRSRCMLHTCIHVYIHIEGVVPATQPAYIYDTWTDRSCMRLRSEECFLFSPFPCFFISLRFSFSEFSSQASLAEPDLLLPTTGPGKFSQSGKTNREIIIQSLPQHTHTLTILTTLTILSQVRF